MSNIRSILLRHIRQDGGTQARAAMDQAAIDEYAEAMEAGARFPPVVVFEDHTSNLLWLGDGFHRVAAAAKLGHKNIRADIREGGLREARLYAIGANVTHGVRRSNADKRLAVTLLLDDPEWSAWSDREIARIAGVSHPMVIQMRKERVVTVTTSEVPTAGNVCSNANEVPAGPSIQEDVQEMEAGAEEQVCGCEGVPHQVPNEQDMEDRGGAQQDPPAQAAQAEEPAAPAEPASEEAGPVPPAPESRDAYVEMLIRVNKEKDADIAELNRKLEEAGSQVQELSEENESYRRTLDGEGDDLLARFDKECKRNQERARVAEARLRGLQGENRDLQHYCKMWKNKFDRLDKERKKASTEPAPKPLAEAV